MKLYTAEAIKEQVHKLLCQDCGETDYCPKCDYLELIDQILDAPTVDAVPVRHGHWIKANDPMSSPFDTMKRCLCSECREWGTVTSYCPNCGARMDEEEK